MSNGAYAPDKAAAHPDRLAQLREGGHPYPVHMHFVLSDLCNLDCPGCAYRMSGYTSNELFAEGADRNPARFLPFATAVTVLGECAEVGVKAVEFTGGGEPTLHADFGVILDHAQTLGLDTAVVTNGLRLARSRSAVARCQWARVSIDAATERTYGIVRPGLGGPRSDGLSRVLAEVTALRHVIDRHGLPCVLGAGFVVQRENWHELHSAVRMFRDAGAHNVRISGLFTPEGAAYHEPHAKLAAELERMAVLDFDRGDFRVHGRFAEKVGDLSDGPPDYERCHYQRFTTYLGGDSKLYRCCVMSYNRRGLLADLKDHGGSFKAAWASPEVRKKLEEFDARGCVRCQFNDRNQAIARHLAQPTTDQVDVVHPNFV